MNDLISFGDSIAYWTIYYQAPWYRTQPYLIGIFVGWILRRYRREEVKLPKAVAVLGWMLSIDTALSVVYGLTEYMGDSIGSEMSDAIAESLEDAENDDEYETWIYGSFHRLAWAASVSWLIFACHYGYGGAINWFLSSKAFVPLSRLSYCTFLVHYNLMNVVYATVKTPIYYSRVGQVYAYLGHLSISIALALIASIAFEAPLIALEKCVTDRFAPPSPSRPPLDVSTCSGADDKTKDDDLVSVNAIIIS